MGVDYLFMRKYCLSKKVIEVSLSISWVTLYIIITNIFPFQIRSVYLLFCCLYFTQLLRSQWTLEK